MRISRVSTAAAVVLLAIGTTAVESSSDSLAGTKADILEPPVGVSDHLSSQKGSASKAAPKGTLDAPVDGKDGKPHDGPWVETAAERDRKKEMADKKTYTVADTEQVENSVGLDGKKIPNSNEGVMDDPSRLGPKEGTRGTEGGMTEKTKDTKQYKDKKPETPKEARPLPHSEQEKIPGYEDSSEVTDQKTGDTLLEKPDDLPEKPHNIPPPKSPGQTTDGSLDYKASPPGRKPFTKTGDSSTGAVSGGNVFSPIHSLFLSFTMILFSEVGDKTFLVAALMAMRHPRLLVFSAAFSALITMTVLSAVLGHAVPTLIPASYTQFAAAILFLVFAAKMFKEGHSMSPDEGVGEEMKEVEMELEEKEHEQRRMRNRRRSSVTPYALEAGRGGRTRSTNRLPSPPESVSSASSREVSPERGFSLNTITAGTANLFSLLLSPAWVQTFVMTFLGEWGDRSQIATIAMAAGQDYWWVTIGAVAGHGICTAAAVIGGRAIAGRVSLRAVTLGGAGAFLVFGIIYLIEAIF
ncbi:GCR1-dependent translation factor 1 [Talaromyces pinophilus]|nr:GCR1-dependent translation factor 1 [Talaromyces pinophilus]